MKKFLCIGLVFIMGCANASLRTTKVDTDPNTGIKTTTTDEVKLSSMFQDFKGSDLAASHTVGGKTTIKAGAVDNTTNAMAADALKEAIDLAKWALQLAIDSKTGTVPTPNSP